MLAVPVRDCARLRRIAYVRAVPFELEELNPRFVGEPTIHRFSAYLLNARDAWSGELASGGRATGTIGGRTLLVTFGKLGHCAPEGQAPLEHWLTEHYGPVVVVPTLLAADRWFQRRSATSSSPG